MHPGHYEETGLVIPSARSQGGFRLYTESDVARLMVIRRMKPLGFSLDKMRALLEATDRLDSDEELPPEEREELLQRIRGFEQVAQQRERTCVPSSPGPRSSRPRWPSASHGLPTPRPESTYERLPLNAAVADPLPDL